MLCTAVTLLQAGLMAAVAVVQDLSRKKAGVNHHLQFRRTDWMHRFFTDFHVALAAVVLAAAAAALIVVACRKRRDLNRPEGYALGNALIWIAVGLYCLYSPTVQALLVYPYLLLAEGIALLLALILVTAVHRSMRKRP